MRVLLIFYRLKLHVHSLISPEPSSPRLRPVLSEEEASACERAHISIVWLPELMEASDSAFMADMLVADMLSSRKSAAEQELLLELLASMRTDEAEKPFCMTAAASVEALCPTIIIFVGSSTRAVGMQITSTWLITMFTSLDRHSVVHAWFYPRHLSSH